jgi:hypothetical protein
MPLTYWGRTTGGQSYCAVPGPLSFLRDSSADPLWAGSSIRHAGGGLYRDGERIECPDVMVGIPCHVRNSIRKQTSPTAGSIDRLVSGHVKVD